MLQRLLILIVLFVILEYIHYSRSWSLEIICLICLGFAICLIFRRNCKKLLSNSTRIIILIIFSLIFYFVYNLSRTNRTFYFLQELFYQVYQACLIFYFGKKLVQGPSKRQNLNIIRTIFGILIILDITTFIISIIEAASKKQMCKQISFTVFRSISLITQILFLVIVEKLYKRFLLNLKNLLKNEQQTKRQKSHFFQLKILCYISFFGSLILLIVNFIYMLSSDCRIIPHYGNGEYNFSDELNALVHTTVKLLTYFIPIILTLVLFTTKNQKEDSNNSAFEVEDLTYQQYFQGLAFDK
ncbi:unnamed protein product (macronuclear) [Paramecium tetraurelia]|uniref:THH1/TOM1/TOM3 domain-containing protein n=1 Tax=Paramecium tetraurelia TaxID=5888 RepID=A0DB54_PARTE|nr:uncharacterized protein GSPATT00015165001 [Paramecium tetraurelia]CAK80271.1 unnamed protein product [Paramecium tetraurelia]|eukprot:XP_001447668.1 hypothetical protein (macronuclear) [Paramecium tetraurelia strain d4-2]